MEEESAVLRKHLVSRASGAEVDQPSSKPEPSGNASKEKEPIDWKNLAEQIIEMKRGGGMGDMRAMMRLQQRLQAMSAGDLVAALDEITALELPEESRMMLEQMLIGPLCQKDPELALTRYADRIGEENGGMSWQLSNAMKEWAGKDSLKAMAWMDQQIAEGNFNSRSLDGKSRPRMQFEGMLIGSLLSSNPTAAADRLRGLPEDQRSEVLRHYTGNAVSEENQLAYADLVRAEIPEEIQADTLAQQASSLAWQEGYQKIDGYLDRIEASPSERAAVVGETLEMKVRQLAEKRAVTREDIDTMRKWADKQSPESTDRVTGKALAHTLSSEHPMKFSEAAELVTQYNDAGGNDKVLIGFLSEPEIRTNKKEARALAERIADPKNREMILERLK